ncbi:SMI1/KNR4 family protein [Luteolibacter arcticus]|uniref:SMI1/KNR4 family protein n=1 Tax=Luteolibacter arcticus TaxID=1581411 RepID=A0ABT3GEM5_9BACT|nr:SMI1/KNR4 family protein [Luteolibacter arcticus]MCW1922061.1 SMI1/KNR4 family protein [Luteolibacter arcticus]
MNALLSKLTERVATPRRYTKDDGWWLVAMKEQYAEMKSAGGRDFAGAKPAKGPQRGTIEYSDLCIRGGGAQEELAEELGFPLPDDYRFFCSIFREYLIAGRSIIRLWDAEDIRDDIEGWDVPRNEPVTLFYFARLPQETARFALRRKPDGEVDVVFSWDYGDLGEPVISSDQEDKFRCDVSFSTWLERMIGTDGFPLFPGGSVPTSEGWGERDHLKPPTAT